MRILLAEDDPISRKLLQSVLQKWGYEVTTVENGNDAWQVLQANDAPPAAILDWMMPGMHGVEVCRKLRQMEDKPYTYVLLLTAKSDKQDLLEAMSAGADDYITKPFDAKELRARLLAGERVLDLQSALMCARDALKQQATHDPLTGLPNRLLFSDRASQKISHARRSSKLLAVMFIDLDRFKAVNDTLGHNMGDLLLIQVSERLRLCLRETDTFARMGGDEFTVVLLDLDDKNAAALVARRVLETLSEPFVLGGHEVFVSASIGISIYPKDGEDIETLVKNADTAMYRAKHHGKNGYQFYDTAMNRIVAQRLSFEAQLRRAVDRNEMLLYYQPRVHTISGKVLGTEALARWKHPELGLVPPATFIPIAEETGLIIPIGEHVIRAATRQQLLWREAGLPLVDVAVNVSAMQLQKTNLAATIQAALEDSTLAPNNLSVEVTESALMWDPELAMARLEEIRALGVRIALDDFGTGYSSLSYLKRYPIDTVKIDRSFVRDVHTDPDDAAIVGAIIAMAHSLNKKVVAEGVETWEQLEFLRSLNCDEMQGYFVSRPVPPEEIAELLKVAPVRGALSCRAA